ncbi:MAG TPA: PmeII family type II restriction endonuclease [Candidatus Nanoarchaeia archaeon]|nr:PmeII family type II restriction endonuclease [Candidatus Nanoarchaeia archaeon]
MKGIPIREAREYIHDNIGQFHEKRLRSLQETKFYDLLKRKNPYLFRAKYILTAESLVTSLEAKLSSSEEEIFGEFLEDLAIFVAQKTLGAVKSSTEGLDFEFTRKNVRYLFAIKSGLNWGNSSQWKALIVSFKRAKQVLNQSRHIKEVKCFLGISYGKVKRTEKKGFILQVCGQEFWAVLSGDPKFYSELIEPIGYKSKELNENFKTEKAKIINKFTRDFLNEFCDESGKILWKKLVKFNSGNMEL